MPGLYYRYKIKNKLRNKENKATYLFVNDLTAHQLQHTNFIMNAEAICNGSSYQFAFNLTY